MLDAKCRRSTSSLRVKDILYIVAECFTHCIYSNTVQWLHWVWIHWNLCCQDVPVDLHIKTMVGYKGSLHYHVFELTRQLPRFSMYALCTVAVNQPQGYVKFKLNERVARVSTMYILYALVIIMLWYTVF